MRLLDSSKYNLNDSYKIKKDLKEQDIHDGPVPYAILSHQWLDAEVTFEDLPDFENLRKQKNLPKELSIRKIEGFCRVASSNYYQYVWLDTCCINQQNPVELSTAINSMYRWYKNAEVCYVYLQDYDSQDEFSDPMKSSWFERGWTLQELIAPRAVEFFDKNWKRIGYKRDNDFQDKLSRRTGISRQILSYQQGVGSTSIAHRMSWFKERKTTVAEDTAYCLIGLFGISMPLLYGEGMERAFRRLQEEIMRYSDDHSLFAWKDPSPTLGRCGLLARSPACFKDTGKYIHIPNRHNNSEYLMTNKGLNIHLYLMKFQNEYIATLDVPEGENNYLSFYLKCESTETQQYSRIDSHKLCRVGKRGNLTRIYVPQPIDI